MRVINKVDMDIYEAEVQIEDVQILNKRGYEVYIADGELIIEERGIYEADQT